MNILTFALPATDKPNSYVQSRALGLSWPSSLSVHRRVIPAGIEVPINMRVSSIKRVSIGVDSGVMLSPLSWLNQEPRKPRSPEGDTSSKSSVGSSMYAAIM